jgi:hypothetical protein
MSDLPESVSRQDPTQAHTPLRGRLFFQVLRDVAFHVGEAGQFAGGQSGFPLMRTAFSRTRSLTNEQSSVSEQDARVGSESNGVWLRDADRLP